MACSRFLLIFISLFFTIKLDYASVLSKETNKKKMQQKIAVELERNEEKLANEIAKTYGLKK